MHKGKDADTMIAFMPNLFYFCSDARRFVKDLKNGTWPIRLAEGYATAQAGAGLLLEWTSP